MMKLIGNVHLFGDNIDTDVIISERYLHTADTGKLAKHCMEDLDPAFAQKVRAGDIVVAGRNFGCGAPREQAPLVLKAAGVSCVIARSFSHAFSRFAKGLGLPLLICDDIFPDAHPGDTLEVDLSTGSIRSLIGARVYRAEISSNVSGCEMHR